MSATMSPRSSTRVANPPGGKSSFSFGGGDEASPLSSPRIAAAVAAPADSEVKCASPPSVVVEDTEEPTILEPETDLETDRLKLQILENLLSCSDAQVLAKVLEILPKKVQEEDAGKAEEAARVQALEAKEDAATKATEAALAQLKAALKGKGCHGIISLAKKFRAMDEDSDHKLSYLEFHNALVQLNIKLGEGAKQALFRSFDADCNGSLSFEEFLAGVRGELNERRQKLVGLAFKALDTAGNGKVTVGDIASKYDTSKHPDVLLGTKTKSDVLAELLDTFEATAGHKDGVLTLAEFEAYYKAVSGCIGDDDYFELVIRNAWHISGGEGWCQNTTCRRVLVLHPDGTQSVEEVKDDLNIAKDDIEAMKANLAARGIEAKKLSFFGDLSDPSSPSLAKAAPPAAPANSRKSHLRSSIVF